MTVRRVGDDRGSVAVEFALAVPIVIVAAVLVSLAWRVTAADSDVQRAAGEAARAGSLTRDPTVARQVARDIAAATLAQRDVTCRQLTVAVDTSAFHPGGRLAVTVTCTVHTADITLVPVPTARTFTGRAVEVIDIRRGGHR